MPRASRSGIRGLYKDGKRYRIDLRWFDKEGRAQRHKEVLPAGTTAAGAKLRAQSILEATLGGRDPRPRKDAAPTLSAAFDQYLNWSETNREKTHRNRKSLVAVWLATVGDVGTEQLGSKLVEQFKERRKAKGAAHGTINRGVAMMKHATSLAARSGWGWVDRETALQIREVKMLKEPPGRQRAIPPEDLAKIFAALQQPETLTLAGKQRQDTQRFARRVVQAALLCGGRLGEVIGLLKSEVDLKAKRGLFARTKSGEKREIVITDPLAAVLKEAMAESKGDHVFVNSRGKPYTSGGFSRHFQRIAERAGVPDITFHDLRRHVGTILINSGERLEVVSKLLGHSNVAVTQRSYAHLATEATAAAFERLAAVQTAGSGVAPALPPAAG